MEEIIRNEWEPHTAPGPMATLAEVEFASYEAQRKHQNINAYTRNLMDSYDRVNDELNKTLGSNLVSPFNRYRGDGMGDAMGAPGRSVHDPAVTFGDPIKEWEAEIDALAAKHPNAAFDWPTLKSRPLVEVAKLMKASEDHQADVSRRRGFIDSKDVPIVGNVPLVGAVVSGTANIVKDPLGMAASLVGSLAGSLESPVDLLANVVGGVAGSASKSLVKNAIRNGLANAGVQSVLEPVVQANRAAGGLEYGWEKAFEDIAGAFGTGAALDLAVRPAGRAAIKRFGTDKPDGTFSRNTPRGGILFDAPEQLPLPPVRARTPDLSPELIERARNDDVAALREIAEKTGIIDQPAVKGALDYAELGGKVDEAAIARFKEMGVDTGEGMRTLAAVMKDPDRFTRMPEPIRQADAPLMREEAQALISERGEQVTAMLAQVPASVARVVAHALEAGLPQVVPLVRDAIAGMERNPTAALTDFTAKIEAMDGLADVAIVHGSNNLVEVADALRRSPQAMDSNVPVSTDFMRTARDLAALEPDAYDMVRSGEVAPAVGAEVANRVIPEHQARVLADLRKAGAETLAQARAVIDDLIPSDRRADDMPLSGGSRIDDPAGPEAKAQTERLREEHADALKEAQAPIKERDKVEAEVETIRGEIAKLEEKVAKTTFDDVGDTFDAPAAERFVDPFDQAPMPKADVDAIVDMWRYVREQNAIADPVSLTEFVRSKGGLKEDAGELKNMLGNYNKRPGLVSKKGMFLDDMTLDAWEAGYLPGTERPEIKTLLDALDNDLRGERVYSELDADTVANKAAAVEMLRDLEEMGIRDARSEAAVRKHFEREGDGGTQGGQGAAKEAGIFAELAAKRDELRTAETRLAELNNDLIPGHYSPMFAFIAERVEMQRAMDVRTAVNDALRLADTILPENARVTVTSDRLRADGVELDAMELRGDITLSLHALDPVARMGHEGVHALVTRGLLKPSEVDLLAQAGREMKVFTPEIEAEYRKAYADRPNLERQIIEEAAAHFVEARIKSPIPEAQTIADRVRALIERVKNALNGYGFNTADDVRSAILRGDVARRQAQQQWMRSNDVTAMVTDGQTMAAFAGERAKTADPVKLGRAKTMDAAGLTREAIWTETGWFKGVDGKWRFEIDDSGSTYDGRRRGKLSRVLDHPELYAAYPEVGRAKVFPRSGNGGGFIAGWTGTISNRIVPHQIEMGLRSDPRSAFLHEAQHGVQKQEGVEYGANINDPNYWENSGEVEARTVEKRMNLSPEQRAARPPWLDYDVPEDQQIVRFADGKHVSEKSYSSEPPVPGFPTLRDTTMYAIRAFHGSPHDFDRFDMSRIGTGEGAQAFGHGLYFAEREGVARSYRDKLSGGMDVRWTGPAAPTDVEAFILRRSGDPELYESTGVLDVDRLKTELAAEIKIARRDLSQAQSQRRRYGPMSEVEVADKRAALALREQALETIDATVPQIEQVKPGRMYEVKINAEPEQFLDWDKPLSQQSETVRAAALNIRNAAARAEYEKRGFPEPLIQEYLGNASKADKTGGQLVQGMKGADQSADLSRQLRDAGIPGIRYLDQGSRSDGVGTYNYVVFDDALITITAKDGTPISAADKSEVMFAIKAFHGSPHDFDRFDLSKIGTGVGASSFGHGLYFSERVRLAQAYLDGMVRVGRPGHLYEVKLNVDEARLLAWDVPLSEQNALVRGAFSADLHDMTGGEAMLTLIERALELHPERLALDSARVAASAAYRTDRTDANMRAMFDTAEAMTQWMRRPITPDQNPSIALSARLRDGGIQGIVYVDDASTNYVVFDDSLITITAKDGTPISAADKSDVMFAIRDGGDTPPSLRNFAAERAYRAALAELEAARKSLSDAVASKSESAIEEAQARMVRAVHDKDLANSERSKASQFGGMSSDNDDAMFALRSSGLDPSPEARKARAGEMGFDTSKVWYHGSNAEFDAFDLNARKPGLLTEFLPKQRDTDLGVHLTMDRDVAATYGKAGEYYVRGKVLSVSSKWDAYRDGLTPRDVAKLKADGYSAIFGREEGELVVFEPSDIRSVNAMFDPDKADSANLMFALSGVKSGAEVIDPSRVELRKTSLKLEGARAAADRYLNFAADFKEHGLEDARALKVQREAIDGDFDPNAAIAIYDIMVDGKKFGDTALVIKGETASVIWIGSHEDNGIGGFSASATLGVPVLKKLRDQFRQDFPEVKRFTGHRISGSRAQATNKMQSVMFALSDPEPPKPPLHSEVAMLDRMNTLKDLAMACKG